MTKSERLFIAEVIDKLTAAMKDIKRKPKTCGVCSWAVHSSAASKEYPLVCRNAKCKETGNLGLKAPACPEGEII